MKIEPREYQKEIFEEILRSGNTLVVLPTGLGKTLIAFLLIEQKMKDGKCLFLAPTKPLVKQHLASFLDICEPNQEIVTIVTGEIPKKNRAILYEKQVIFSTPQTIKNDLKTGTFKQPDSVALCIFDEAHRAIGNYAYTFVAESLKETALIVGLTASPGGNNERIKKTLGNLYIQNVQIRSKNDSDVAPYVKDIKINWIETELTPDLMEIKNHLGALIGENARKLASFGFPPPLKSKRLFMALRQRILNHSSNAKYAALVIYGMLLNLLHMQELVETQGPEVLRIYIEKLKQKETKGAKILLKKPGFAAMEAILARSSEEHPKLPILLNLLKANPGKTIVFAQYRDQVALIEAALNKEGIPSRIFLGRKGEYTKKEQEETLAQFREDKFRVLVASTIGEEGLDIPAVDNVVFYEPTPSEIRSIQRRGRAGRFKEGHVYILITKGTRDEYFYWASVNREKRMKNILGRMQKPKSVKTNPTNEPQKKVRTDKTGQSTLDSFL
ncbi:MAG: helicase-related protein [Candidatus ainarchaeum sp.]|nr:helicase-related protein [Candidatus ainarchaeum sp.]